MSLNKPEYVNSVKLTSVIGWITLFIGVIGATTWYTTRTSQHVNNDQASQNKISALDEAFQSLLGPKWPYVLLFFTIFLGLCLVLLYTASKKEAITINMSDKASKTLTTVLIVFTVLFSITVIFLTVKQSSKKNDIPNYKPSIADQEKLKKIMIIIGLLLFIGVAIWYFFNRK